MASTAATPDLIVAPGLSLRTPQRVQGWAPWAFWLVLYFFLTYFETQSVGGVKYAVLWRSAVFLPALFVIWTHPLPMGARAMASLFWAYLFFCFGPIWGIALGIPDVAYSVNLSANRMFVPIMLMALMALRWYSVADLAVRVFPLFLCLISIPLLAGILPPVGLQWSLAAVSGIDLTAYNSVFQNQHSASLAHAIAGISAFTLAARFPGKRSFFYLALAMGCLALCVLTTARAGLLGMILGLILVAFFTRKMKLLAAPVVLVFVALLVTAMIKPEMIQMVQNRLTGQTLYTHGPSADTLTSGRLTLQADALRGWSQSEPLQLIFGIGREGTKNNNLRLNGSHLIAHSAFIDELSAYGIVGFMSLMITLFMAYRLAWRNARQGYPAGLACLVALCVFGSLQAMDYSFQNMIIGMVLVLETRAASIKQNQSARA
ncbi:O-antigen ligase family protein [Lautropia mirabilis]|jgi:membrane protein